MRFPYHFDVRNDTPAGRQQGKALIETLTWADQVWVTAAADQPSILRTRRLWRLLTDLLSRAFPDGPSNTTPGRHQLHLADNTPGSRGHLTLPDGTRIDLLCLEDDQSPTAALAVARMYLFVAPTWMHQQPPHTRRVLHALSTYYATPPDRHGNGDKRFHELGTGELLATAGPLLDLPAPAAHVLADMLWNNPAGTRPSLAEIHNIARALA